MIVWHAMDRHVQLHNGNLMIEASTTFLFDSVVLGRWKRKISHDRGPALAVFSKRKNINYAMLITNRVDFFKKEKRKTIYTTITSSKVVGYEWFILILCNSDANTK